MPIFMNPFQTHHVSDFPDVYVPLSRATRKPSVVAAHDRKMRFASDTPGMDGAGEANVVNTVEGLRVEIDQGTLEDLTIYTDR